jgi:hypothetical protein
MTFHPNPNSPLNINGRTYQFATHPAAPGMPYGQEGRVATVYKLLSDNGGAQALKVFRPKYRFPALVGLADRLAPFAKIPGLAACEHTVLSARRHSDLLRQHPDLTYSALMPWIDGPTWLDILLTKHALSSEQSLHLACALLEVLTDMEEQGIAHCDLSGPNVILPALADASSISSSNQQVSPVELIDVEQLFGPGLERPPVVPGGSAGYAHKQAPQGLWSAVADRFSGTILVSEMLSWCDVRIREAALGESYFDPNELPSAGSIDSRVPERYSLMVRVLRERWGENVDRLFQQAWYSETLFDCPSFGEWLAILPDSHLPTREAIAGPKNRTSTGEKQRRPEPKSGRPAEPKRRDTARPYKPKAHDVPTPGSKGEPAGWNPLPSGSGNARLRQMVLYLAAFAATAVVTSGFIFAINRGLIELSLGIFRWIGSVGVQTISSFALATLVGMLQVWMFRFRIQPGRQIIFVGVTSLSGLFGGFVGAQLMSLLGMLDNGYLVGVVIGAYAGGLASLGQNIIGRNHGLATKWFVWNTISWALIWGLGWVIAWNLDSFIGYIVALALATTVMLLSTGVTTILFLRLSPEFEF